MRKLIFILFFMTSLPALRVAAQGGQDSLDFTEITTTDFMQTRQSGSMDWGAAYAARKFCIFGRCGGSGTTVADNAECCTLGAFLIRIFGWMGGNGGSSGSSNDGGEAEPDDDLDVPDGGGGDGPMPPPPDVYPGGGICEECPPPAPPPPLNDDGPDDGTEEGVTEIEPPDFPGLELDSSFIKKDCAGVKDGTACIDSCGYCVGGTTGKDSCICPTDSTFTVTRDMLTVINPLSKMKAVDTAIAKQNMDSVAKYINLYKDDPDFKINTRLRLAHFLAQISVETGGFTKFVEDHHYSKKNLLTNYSKLFDSTNVDQYVNCICVFDKLYCCRYGNGDTASTDGSKYRGQGAIHLTWRGNYIEFNNYYQQKFSDTSVSFVTNPELLQTNMKYATIAALWYIGKFKKLNDEADDDDVLAYSKGVNCGSPKAKCDPNGYQERKAKLASAKKTLCL